MSVFRTKRLVTPLILLGLTLPVFAQSTDTSSNRAASFLPDATDAGSATPDFSGLAAAPPELVPPPTSAAAPAAAAAPPSPAPETAAPAPTSAPPVAAAPPTATTPVSAPAPEKPAEPAVAATAALVSLQGNTNESIGIAGTDTLGAAMWKGTSRPAALRLLSFAVPTSSPDLNNLMRRLLTTPAAPPENDSDASFDAAQTLTAMRVEKLVSFGDSSDAWALATHADASLIDDITFHFAAEAELANDAAPVCAMMPNMVKARASVDWLKSIAVCQLHTKDSSAAQATLDLLRAEPNRDDMFLEVADKNILGEGKNLPHQLTPLTPPMLALLRLTGLPLPGELYGHPDFALAPALLTITARQDVAQLGLAERAAGRGIIGSAALGAVYRTAIFSPEQLIAPLIASESGSRLRALLYQAAVGEKDEDKRVAYTIRFLQSASPDFLNGAGAVMGDMLGTVKADAAQSDNAAALAEIYVIAGRGDLALDWLRLARRNPALAADLQTLWPHSTLAGLEAESDYAADRDHWLDAALKPADPQADMRAARDATATTLLLLDAAGFAVPDSAWVRVMAASHNEKHLALSPVLLTRLQEASAAGRDGETVLLATDLASDSDIPLPMALAITRALRAAGFKSDAATFARHMVALSVKSN
jgi:hypothetical protein